MALTRYAAFPVTLSAHRRGLGHRTGSTTSSGEPPRSSGTRVPAALNGAGEGEGSGRHPENLHSTTIPARMARPAALTIKSMGNTTGLDAGAGVVELCRFPATLSPQSRGFGHTSRPNQGLRRTATDPHPPPSPCWPFPADRPRQQRAPTSRPRSPTPPQKLRDRLGERLGREPLEGRPDQQRRVGRVAHVPALDQHLRDRGQVEAGEVVAIGDPVDAVVG